MGNLLNELTHTFLLIFESSFFSDARWIVSDFGIKFSIYSFIYHKKCIWRNKYTYTYINHTLNYTCTHRSIYKIKWSSEI